MHASVPNAALEPCIDPTRRRRALTLSVFDGLVHAAMLGVTEHYLGALAVELGHSATNQALLTTVPVLIGALSQLAAPSLTRLFGSRKRFVVFGAVLQALSHFWFIDIAAQEDGRLWGFLLAKSLYFSGGMMIAPAWGAWMATLTADIARQKYFARRSAGIYGVLLAAFMAGAHLLNRSADHHALLKTYATLFWVGLAARTLSSFTLAAQYDPGTTTKPASLFELYARSREALSRADFQVAIYVAALMFGANIAVPFFVPYWLSVLHVDYATYALLIGTALLSKALAFPAYDPIARRIGMPKLLYASGFVVALLPAAWALTTDLFAFVIIQVVSGVAWAAIEYASFQLLIDSSDEDIRLEFLSLAGTLSGVAQVAGSLLGSALIDGLGFAYTDVFIVSTMARAMPLLWALFSRRKTREMAYQPPI